MATYRDDDENDGDDEGDDGEDEENEGEVEGGSGRMMGAMVYVRGYVLGANVEECWMSDTNRVNYRNGKRVNTFGRHVTR